MCKTSAVPAEGEQAEAAFAVQAAAAAAFAEGERPTEFCSHNPKTAQQGVELTRPIH